MPSTERKLAAILSADVVGYSRLMAEDEAGTIQTLTDYREEIAMLVRQHRGRVVDSPGDNLLAEFPAALDAVRSAVEIQRSIRVRNTDLPAERRMEFRIGVHLGDVAVEGERVYGDGVNIAARLEGLAEPGGVCISSEIHGQVESKLDLRFEDLGEQSIKNMPKPVRVFRVREAPLSEVQPPSRTRGGRVAAAAVIVAVLAIAVAIYFSRQASILNSPPLSSVAVLPFEDMSPGGDQEYFADGISEELINALTKVPGLRVVARTSAFAFKGKNQDIRTIGDQLNVGAVIEGSVRKAGQRIRITAQLVRVTDGFHIWSDTYDRKLDDVFAIQEEIARATVDALQVRLASRPPLVRRPTGDFRAYEMYLTGRHFWNQRTEEGFRKAISYFEKALKADPNYSLAYVGLADSYVLTWLYGYEGYEEALTRAEVAARRALTIDESRGEAHASLAFIRRVQRRWDEAEREFTRALELNPGHPTAHQWYSAFLLGVVGRAVDAIAEMERALDLDPLSPIINRDAGRTYLFTGDYEAAIERARRALELNPEEPGARIVLTLANFGQARKPQRFDLFASHGNQREVQEALQLAYEAGGSRAVVRKSLELRIAETQTRCPTPLYWTVRYFAELGEVDEMFECFQYAVDHGRILDPLAGLYFDPYRDDPRFTALLRQMGLEE
jgi:TolB-like protein/class 3 adenylate cyclase/Tfp pilus assembly protein PilF